MQDLSLIVWRNYKSIEFFTTKQMENNTFVAEKDEVFPCNCERMT